MIDLLVPGNLATVQERRLSRALRYSADESIEVAGGCVGFSGLGSWSNQAVGLGFAGDVSAQDIDQVIDFLASRGAEPKVELAPHAHASCAARLREAGFVLNGFEQVLVRSFQPDAGPLAEFDSLIRLEVADVSDAATVAQVLDVQAKAFASDESAVPDEHHRRLFTRYMTHPNVRAVVAYVGNEPAGAGVVEIDPPLSQLFGGGTRPSFRSRGVQRALIVARLRLAQDAGCLFAGTESVPGGGTERNAIRLGFHPAYTRVSLVRPGEGLVRSP